MDDKTLNTVLLGLVILLIGIPMLWRHIQYKRDDTRWEYYVKFVQPKFQRAIDLGISDKRIGELWVEAQNSVTDPTIVGGAPGSIFNALIDREVEKQK